MTEPDDLPLSERCVMPHPAPTKREHGYLCRRDYHEMGNRLDEIERDAALMPLALLPRVAPSGNRISGGKEVGSPAPGRLGPMMATDRRMHITGYDWLDAEGELPVRNLAATLDSWVQMILEDREQQSNREALPTHGPVCPYVASTTKEPRRYCGHQSCVAVRLAHATRDDDGLRITVAVRVLRRERHFIAAQPWVDTFLDELAAVHRDIAAVVGNNVWEQPIGVCPACDAKLFAHVENGRGVDEVTCRKCRASWRGIDLARDAARRKLVTGA